MTGEQPYAKVVVEKQSQVSGVASVRKPQYLNVPYNCRHPLKDIFSTQLLIISLLQGCHDLSSLLGHTLQPPWCSAGKHAHSDATRYHDLKNLKMRAKINLSIFTMFFSRITSQQCNVVCQTCSDTKVWTVTVFDQYHNECSQYLKIICIL
jgi:hypothetical protein